MGEWDVVDVADSGQAAPRSQSGGNEWDVVASEPMQLDYALKENQQPATLPESGPIDQETMTPATTGPAGTGHGGLTIDSESFVRPALEFGGMAAGGAIGAPTGPVGSVAAGGMGYALGKNVADVIYSKDQPESVVDAVGKAIKDTATGSMMEAGGQIVGKAAGSTANAVTDYIARKFKPTRIAADTLRANTTTGQIFAKNADEAKAIEAEIPGLKFTPGQASADPARMKLERGRAATSGDAAATMQTVRDQNEKAIADYVEKTFGGDVDAAFARIDEVKQGLDSAVSGAKGEIGKAVSKYGQGDIQLGGQSVRSALQRGRDEAKGTAKAMYDEIPEGIALKSDELARSISSMADEFKKSGDAISDLPRGIIKQIDEIIRPDKLKNPILDASGKPFQSTTAPKEIDFKTLRGIRSQIGEAIGDASRGANPNYKLSRRLATLRGAVEKTLDQLEKQPGQIGGKYKAATKFYRESYVPKWRKGAVSELLKPGNSPEGFKVGDAEVIGKVFRPGNKGLDAADQLLSVSRGNDDVLNVVKDYAEQRLLQEATDKLTGEVTEKGLANFRAKYGTVLKKFGIDGQFKNLASLEGKLTGAMEKRAAFEKSAAGALLKTDPETAISKALSGSGSQREKMAELVKAVNGKPEAHKGLKRAMIDHIAKSIQPTAASPLAKSLRKYDPAIKELFKDEPQQLAALSNVRRAYEIMNRTARGTTGGADTAEKLSAFLQHLSGGRTVGVLRLMIGPFRDHIGKKSDALINKSLYDPELARALVQAANGNKKFDGKLIEALTKYSSVEALQE